MQLCIILSEKETLDMLKGDKAITKPMMAWLGTLQMKVFVRNIPV